MKNGKLIDQVEVVTGSSKGIGAGIAKHPPLRRIGQPHDIAPVVAFLASPESAWITGEMITVFPAGFTDCHQARSALRFAKAHELAADYGILFG